MTVVIEKNIFFFFNHVTPIAGDHQFKDYSIYMYHRCGS